MYYNYSDLNYINQELAVVWPGWTAVKLLGRGSFGAVYEIHRSARGNLEKSAMKVLRVPDNDAEVARLQFQGMNYQSTEAYYEKLVDGIYNEIRIMQSFIGYSHIVSYEDYAIRKRNNEIGWDIYIRMELLTGLPDYISRHPMSNQIVFKLGMDIAQGLSDCHNKGIIHRDIKPENVFVNEAGNFKLGDFGVSRNALGSQDVLSFKGTLAYMAPEVYKMQATDARSDIYSLGVVLYQCLNDNRLPFVPEGFSPYDIETARQRRLAGEPIPAPAHGSNNLKSIVLKALAVRPEYRFQTAEEMYRALRQAYEADYNESVTLYQNTQYQQPVKRPFPLIPVVATVALVLTVIAGAGIISLFIRKGDNAGTEQVAQIAETVQTEQISQNGDEQLAEETQADNSEAVEEQNDEPAEEEFTDYAIDWKDAALEAKMREITGISSGDIMYSDVKDITMLDLANWHVETDDVKIKDISALSSLTNLEMMFLNNNSISDISALGSLTNLTYLSMRDNQISDISALSGLTNLEELYLSDNQISNISVLDSLMKLKKLELDNNQISDISALGSLANLTDLVLYNNQISDIRGLDGLKKLKELDLKNNQISNISGLGNLTSLTNLDLYNNQISDISVLGGLTNLTNLDLSINRVSDISALSNLKNLIALHLWDNQISDISALGNLTNLTWLFLHYNQISDISPLSNLTNLTWLDISDNPISDYSPIEDLNIETLTK